MPPSAQRLMGHPLGDGEWLSIGPASRIVCVDPDTLRRWAELGRIEAFVTPGGHRRFARSSLEAIVAGRHVERPVMVRLGATPARLTAAYRRSYGAGAQNGDTPGLTDVRGAIDPPDREAFRTDGRLLVRSLLRFLNSPSDAVRVQAEHDAGALSADLATRLAAGGISLTESVALFVVARRPFLAELGGLARRRGLTSAQQSRLYESAAAVLDRLLLGFIAAHQVRSTSDPIAASAAVAASAGRAVVAASAGSATDTPTSRLDAPAPAAVAALASLG